MDPVRLGIIGVGTITLRGLLPHLTLPDMAGRVSVRALVDPVAERAAAAAERYGVPEHFRTLEELLDDDRVDAVSIASPIGQHYEQGLTAIEAGKHVHFNKTMSTTVGESDRLIKAAERNGIRLVASPGDVLLPQVTRVRELIAEGAIGKLAWAIGGGAFGSYHENEAERLSAPGGTAIDPGWYFREPGGGPLYDMTVYTLHRMTSVLGPAKRVTALSGQTLAHRKFLGADLAATADDNTIGLLDFGDNVFAVIYGAPSGLPSDEVGGVRYFGSAGVIDGLLLNGEPFDFPGRDVLDAARPGDFAAPKRLLPHSVGAHRDLPEPHVYEDVMQLVTWVQDGTPSQVSAEHARHVIDIIESVYRSAHTGQTQSLTTTYAFPPS